MLAVERIAHIDHNDAARWHAPGVLGNELLGRRGDEREAAADLVRRLLHEVAIEAHELSGCRARMQYHPGEHDRAHRVEAKLELGHDAEVAAAALEAPEEVGVFVLAGSDDLTVGGHHLGCYEALTRHAVLALQPSRAAAERQTRDPGVRDAPTSDRQAVLLCRSVELTPREAGAEAARAPVDVDINAL